MELALICGFEIWLLQKFVNAFLNVKNKVWVNRINILITIITLVLINNYHNPTINLACVPIIYCVFLIINYSGTIVNSIILGIGFYVLAMVSEFFVLVVFSLTSYHDLELILNNELSGLSLTLLAKVITFIIVMTIERNCNKHDYIETKKHIFGALLVLPIATMILLIAIFYADIHISEKNRILLSIGTILILLANVFMFYLFDQLVLNMEKIRKVERLYMKNKTENMHYQQIEETNEKHRELLHDIKKYIQTAVDMIASSEITKAIQIFEELDIKIMGISKIRYCNHKVVNAIFREKKRIAEEVGCRYCVNLPLDLDMGIMNDIDTISIIGNLMDNAIEATSTLRDKGFIEVQMNMVNEGYFLLLEVKNNFLNSPVLNERGYVTSKQNKKEHGIGIHMVEKIVKKYGGNIKIDVINNEFIISIMLQVRGDKL